MLQRLGCRKAIEATTLLTQGVVLGIDSDISETHVEAMKSLEYYKAGKIAFESKRFWERDHSIYGEISWTNQDITQIWYPPTGFHQDRGVIVGAYIWDDEPGEKFAALSSRARVELAVEQGSKLHPEYANYVRNGISRSWLNTKWVQGGWRNGDANPVLNEPHGNIYFAGEHTSNLAGWQEGSILSAQRAISQIHERESFYQANEPG